MPKSKASKGPEMPKAQNSLKTIGRIIRYLGRYKWMIAVVLVLVMIGEATGVVNVYLLKPLINDCIVPLIGKENLTAADFAPLGRMTLILIGIYLAGTLATLIYGQMMVKISNGVLNTIRRDLFNSVQDLPVQYFDLRTHGEIMSRFTSDVDTFRDAIVSGITQIVSCTVAVVGMFVMMLILSPLLTLLIVGMLAVMLLILQKIGGKAARYFQKQQAAVGKVNGYIEEMIEGQKVVKVFNHESVVQDEFAALNQDLRDASASANTFASVMMPIMGNLSYVNYALTAVCGSAMVITGSMDLGTIISFLQYTRSFSQPITRISQLFNAFFAALAGAERIFEVIDSKPEEDNGYVELVNVEYASDGNPVESGKHTGQWAWKHPHHDGTTTYAPMNGAVDFENVTFSYDGKKTVLEDVSLYAKPGQKIALVGSTGAGKTTITNLINRFYELQSGKIRYDGINIEKIKKGDLRSALSMVLQDTHLFTGTVRENIRYGRLDATDEEVVAAARLANADSFIRHLPYGYDTMLTADGSNLSQGQRQLLAIARAAVADPPVLILDEATSSIDTRTEALIEKGMDQLMHGRTVFVIAHRLSTVHNADAIMVLENGQIIERGNHDELVAQKGRYYQLYTGQFELS